MTSQVTLRILVAEDNKINQIVISKLLEKLGHSFDVVGDGAQAVAAIEKENYDLILMDIRMPKMSGIDASRLIRAMDGDKGRIPIIAVTADVIEEHQEVYFQTGIDKVVPKPIDYAVLAEAIDALTGRDGPALMSEPPEGIAAR